MKAIVTFLQGKKTYIGAALIAAAVIGGFFGGVVSPDNLVIGLGLAIGISGLGAKIERYVTPQQAAAIAEDLKAKNYKGAASDAIGDAAQAAGTAKQ